MLINSLKFALYWKQTLEAMPYIDCAATEFDEFPKKMLPYKLFLAGNQLFKWYNDNIRSLMS